MGKRQCHPDAGNALEKPRDEMPLTRARIPRGEEQICEISSVVIPRINDEEHIKPVGLERAPKEELLDYRVLKRDRPPP